MKVQSVFSPLAGVVRFLSVGRGRVSRRLWVGHGRAHIEVRGLHRPGTEAVARHLEAELVRLRGVHWAEVNAVVGRVVVDFEGGEMDVEDLVDVVEGVEELHDLHEERFPHDRPEHPADVEPQRRQLMAVGADLAGLGLSVFGRVLRTSPLSAEVASLLALADSTPRVRQRLESGLGRATADLTLALGNAITQGLAQGPLGLLVDASHRLSLASEIAARRRVWHEREPELSARSGYHRSAPLPHASRTVPLPSGSVERHADRAALATMVGGAAVFAATWDYGRTVAAFVAGMPKAARLTRDAFASQLGRVLCSRGVVPLDGEVLRRLDRIDTVVIDSRVLLTGRFVLGPVVVLDDVGPEEESRLRMRAGNLLDPVAPNAVRPARGWSLEPLTDVAGHSSREARAAARRLARPGTLVLGLFRHGQLLAVAVAEPELDPLTGPLVSAARSAGELVVAGVGSGLGERLAVDPVVPTGARLAAAIRELQEQGRAVALVSGGGAAALAAADCGIGVLDETRQPPWGAHLLCGPGLAEACLLLEATAGAKAVSRRGVLLAMYGFVAGALLALAGPRRGATGRALVAVNAAAAVGLAAGAWSAVSLAHRPGPSPSDADDRHVLETDAALGVWAVRRRGCPR